jgi:hypothetical protein
MKFWQAVFAANLRARLIGDPAPALTFRRCRRILFSQIALQPAGLFFLPLAFVTLLSFPWVYAFYQTLTARADTEATGLRDFLKKSMREASHWPGQNIQLLAIMAAFGLYVFLNWVTVCFTLPGLVKILFGIESMFTRSSSSLLNTTFFAAMFWLTYLCVDPILKAVYALRCFYGESRKSGDDLKAELRQFSIPAPALAVTLAVLLVGLAGVCQTAGEVAQVSRPGVSPISNRQGVESTRHAGTFARSQAGSTAIQQVGKPALLAAFNDLTIPRFNPLTSASTAEAPAQSPPPSVSPPQLDRAIQDTIHQRKYTWRAPRKKTAEPEETANNGIISRFLDRVREMLGKWFKGFGNWLDRLFRKLFGNQGPSAPASSGYNWMRLLQFLLWVLAAAVIAGIIIFLYRIVRDRRRRDAPIASEPIQPLPDLTDENVGADQLPEDGWTKLARELLGRGEFRLALRAFYLASLANLATRNLITLAKFKSNRDYERELGRRGHSFPDLLSIFGQNVSVFDRIWYGLHEINGDLVNQFAANVERIKTGV